MQVLKSEAAIDARARRAAKRLGLVASKTRWRRDSVDNYGKFTLIDPYRNSILAGEKYDLDGEAVIEFCRSYANL
jgi:hypothetical protein